MKASHLRDADRLAELLADEASAALDSSDAPELRDLLDRNPGMGRDEFMQAAGLAQVVFLRQSQRPAGGRRFAGLVEQALSHRLGRLKRRRFAGIATLDRSAQRPGGGKALAQV